MKKTITLLFASILLLAVMVTAAFVSAGDAMSFTDVSEKDWFYSSVKTVYDAKIMQGEPGNIFSPNKPMTRAELVTLLCNFSREDSAGLGKDLSFGDVAANAWYADSVGWSVKAEIVRDPAAANFAPDEPITRQELAFMVNRYIQYASLTVQGKELIQGFEDKDTFPSWAAEHIESLRKMGILNGKNAGCYDPEATTTRAEVATIITRLMANVVDGMDVSPDGTQFVYYGDMTEAALNAWFAEIAVNSKTGVSANVEGFSDILAAYEALPAADFLRSDITVRFDSAFAAPVTRTYKFAVQAEGVDADDATPDNIGVQFESDGIKFSYLRLVATKSTPLYSTSTGVHGGHENRIIRTENGTYGAYIIRETTGPTTTHPLWMNGEAEAAIFKMTSDGFKIIHRYEFPRNNSSCTPNIMYGGDGMIYVTTIAGDEETYQTEFVQMGYPSTGYNSSAWLEVFVVDTNTDKMVHHAKSLQRYDTHPFVDHGYGKTNPIIDVENGKIYALANGGDAPQAFLAWFIYDIKKGEWEEGCHTIQLPERRDYINGFADGNGGFTFVIQRGGSIKNRTETTGLRFDGEQYLWDGVYVYNVPDAYGTEYREIIVRVPEYSTTQINKPQHINYFGDGDGGGTSYMDFDGNLHILYTHAKDDKYTTYHAIYDAELNEVLNEPIQFEEEQDTAENKYTFGMTQGPSGKYYIIAENVSAEGSKAASFEIWSSDDGIHFEETVERHTLRLRNNKTVESGRLSVANSRMNGVVDGIVPIIFNGYYKEQFCFYSIVLELP
ncbi:MAG: S-layer homology domain-containing protein [Clostridia bacterium]|nr:S-layer homology domain-containing protein [Clostridia bacterium]